MTLPQYFGDSQLWRFLTNALAWPSYQLPGLFVDNPFSHAVNGSLWSIPVELQCYVALAFLMSMRLVQRRQVVLIICLAALALTVAPFVINAQSGVNFIFSRFVRLFAYFMVGSMAYVYREKIPLHPALFLVAAATSIVLVSTDHRAIVLPLAVGYCTIFLAATPLPRLPGLPKGDFSYGVYVYAFPIQQAVIALMPRPMHWTVNVLIALPLTLMFAIASWHLVEHPALQWKKRLGKPPLRRDPVSVTDAFDQPTPVAALSRSA
jgi:peptidoglycan/LPS O-acetylase OafA/YrhL